MKKKPTEQQIDDILNKCADMMDLGENPYFGMTYAEGIDAAIKWMLGEGSHPFDGME